jgi:DNA invertase Pin-like site-specific DNA recombinase
MERAHKIRRTSTLQKRGHIEVLQGPSSTSMVLGYARVSRDDQNLDMQLSALKESGAQRFFVEKISATNAHRHQFRLLMKCVEKGDTVLVYAFNRLVRDLKHLLTIVDEFKILGVKLKSTSEPHIDPFSTNGRMILSVTGAVDENELRRIKDRTRDGMQARKKAGMFFGRKRVVTPEVEREMRRLRYRKKNPVAVEHIADHFNVKPSTVYANTKL